MSKPPSSSKPLSGLTHLGHLSETPQEPAASILERVPNPHPKDNYVARFTAPEFTSLCPVTGQPDFAHLVIDLIPDRWLVESKSLKLYLASFRNHGAFHEDCTVRIGKDIAGMFQAEGFSFVGQSENVGMIFIKLTDWSKRSQSAMLPGECPGKCRTSNSRSPVPTMCPSDTRRVGSTAARW